MVVGLDSKPGQSWFIDDDGDSLSYAVVSSNSEVVDVRIGYGSYTDPRTGQFYTDTRILVTANAIGISTITITANDGKRGSQSAVPPIVLHSSTDRRAGKEE